MDEKKNFFGKKRNKGENLFGCSFYIYAVVVVVVAAVIVVVKKRAYIEGL